MGLYSKHLYHDATIVQFKQLKIGENDIVTGNVASKIAKDIVLLVIIYAIITSYLNEGVGARSVIVGQFLHRHSYAACISFNGTVLTLAIYWVLWEMASGLKGIVFWPHDERWSDKRP